MPPGRLAAKARGVAVAGQAMPLRPPALRIRFPLASRRRGGRRLVIAAPRRLGLAQGWDQPRDAVARPALMNWRRLRRRHPTRALTSFTPAVRSTAAPP